MTVVSKQVCENDLGFKAYMILPKHQQVVRSFVHAVRFNALLQAIVEPFVQQVMNENSDINGTAAVTAAANMYAYAIKGIQWMKKMLT